MQLKTVGLDIAKNVFQLHGADEAGKAMFRKQLRRPKVLAFFRACPPCTVALEACGGAHYWAREIAKLGHDVRMIPPAYVRPFVKRQKNDAADAEGICEAVQRPSMRFVPVKSEQTQASAMVFRARDLVVRQRIQLINALRGHLAEFGIIAPQGPSHVPRLIEFVRNPASGLPDTARSVLNILIDALHVLEEKVKLLDKEIAKRSQEDEDARRLATIPGIGPITATALIALAPSVTNFRRGRDFAAWLGLTPKQHSTGGKQIIGATSKMGERTLRRLLILGACTVVQHAGQRQIPKGSWLARMLARKPRMLTIVALANKMARIVWALMNHGGVYQASVGALA